MGVLPCVCVPCICGGGAFTGVNVRYEYIESIVHLDAYSSSLICGVNGRLIGTWCNLFFNVVLIQTPLYGAKILFEDTFKKDVFGVLSRSLRCDASKAIIMI
jgi:hypothetical protein